MLPEDCSKPLAKMAAGIAVPQVMPKALRNDQVAVARAVSASVSGARTAGSNIGTTMPAPPASIIWKSTHVAVEEFSSRRLKSPNPIIIANPAW